MLDPLVVLVVGRCPPGGPALRPDLLVEQIEPGVSDIVDPASDVSFFDGIGQVKPGDGGWVAHIQDGMILSVGQEILRLRFRCCAKQKRTPKSGKCRFRGSLFLSESNQFSVGTDLERTRLIFSGSVLLSSSASPILEQTHMNHLPGSKSYQRVPVRKSFGNV